MRDIAVDIIASLRRGVSIYVLGDRLGMNVPEMDAVLQQHGFTLDDNDMPVWGFMSVPEMDLRQSISHVDDIERAVDRIIGFRWPVAGMPDGMS